MYNPLIASGTGKRTISGASLSVNATSGDIQTAPFEGSIEANGKDLRFNDGAFSLKDLDGPDSNGHYTNGTLKVLIDKPSVFSYSARYSVTDLNSQIATVGALGIPTLSADLPGSGTAKYRGIGELTEVYKQVINHRAISSVDVDFKTGKVNAALESAEAFTPLGSNVKRLSARGMQLNGTQYSGTNVKMFDSGNTRIYPTGTDAQNQAQGQFFGAKDDGKGRLIPAETGGVIVSRGKDAVVFGSFLSK